jgi:hypothetical protein
MTTNGDFYDERLRTPYNMLTHIVSRYHASLAVRFDAIRDALDDHRTRRTNAKIFICYASDDRPRVLPLYRRLSHAGFDAWYDEVSLNGGDDWRLRIQAALREAHAVVVCLSTASCNKRGFVQKEIALALEFAAYQPEGRAFIIPVRLEPCKVPERLLRWQWVDLFERTGFTRLQKALLRVPELEPASA